MKKSHSPIYNNKAPADKAQLLNQGVDRLIPADNLSALHAQQLSAGLYLVATPIGNLYDITLRALYILQKCDILLCEDSRITKKLLQFFNIASSNLQIYHDHNGTKMRPKILQWLAQGKIIALVSDAGTPLISDPGYKLVTDCHQQKTPVFTVPGACAAISALTLSGMPTDQFVFLGFLPRQKKAIHQLISSVKPLSASIVIYESALRIHASLQILLEILGNRKVALARELTKIYEQVRWLELDNIPDDLMLKGEYVIVVAGHDGVIDASADSMDKVLLPLLAELNLKQAVQLTAKITNIKKQEIYQYALKLKQQEEDDNDEESE